MTLNSETILALATDAGSLSNGKKLATPSKWPSLNVLSNVLWGECQGSGKNPYLVAVDLNGLVVKCSCPSRKFPCKHGLALMLLFVSHADKFGSKDAPESIKTWLAGREERAQKADIATMENAEGKAAPNPVAQAKRRAAREKKVSDGLALLHIFLKDLVRDGLSVAATRSYREWDNLAARLIDSQAVGVARQVRQIPKFLTDFAELLAHLGKLALICEGWSNRENLSADEQADLRTTIGFPLDQAGLLLEDGIKTRWHVLGQALLTEDLLMIRRTWLRRESLAQSSGPEMALILEFSGLGQAMSAALVVGSYLEAELCFAPSAYPQRAVLKGIPQQLEPAKDLSILGEPMSLEAMLSAHADALAVNPWLERAGYVVGLVQLGLTTTAAFVVNTEGQSLPVAASSDTLFTYLALSGGHPINIFAEWDGQSLLLLSMEVKGQWIPLRGQYE